MPEAIVPIVQIITSIILLFTYSWRLTVSGARPVRSCRRAHLPAPVLNPPHSPTAALP